MRRSALIGALVLLAPLAACKREPSFDERYAGAEKTIRKKASELDQDMVKRAQEARAATDAVPTDSGSEAPPHGKI